MQYKNTGRIAVLATGLALLVGCGGKDKAPSLVEYPIGRGVSVKVRPQVMDKIQDLQDYETLVDAYGRFAVNVTRSVFAQDDSLDGFLGQYQNRQAKQVGGQTSTKVKVEATRNVSVSRNVGVQTSTATSDLGKTATSASPTDSLRTPVEPDTTRKG